MRLIVFTDGKAHVQCRDDGLVSAEPLRSRVEKLAEFLGMEPDGGLEAALEKGQTIGRPLLDESALIELEKRLQRPLRPGKRGRPKAQRDDPYQQQLV